MGRQCQFVGVPALLDIFAQRVGKSIHPWPGGLHDLAILPLPGPGLTAHNEAYVAPRAAIGKNILAQSDTLITSDATLPLPWSDDAIAVLEEELEDDTTGN